MAKYTKKEFAEACGVKTNYLNVYLHPSNGGLVADADGFIDTDDPKNFQFLQRRAAKKKKPSTVMHNASESEQSDNLDGIPHFEESERKLKYLDTLKREKEVEKLEIDIQKKRGEVIPSELIPPVILQHNQSIITAFKNEHEEWLRNFAKRHGMNLNEVAEARSQCVGWINTAMGKATDITINAVEGIVQNYMEKRGVGERIGN